MAKYYNVEPLVNLLADKDPLEAVNVGAVLQSLQHGLYNGEVAPVVHAHWILYDDNKDIWDCSNCKVHVFANVLFCKGGYCPNCGAKMDEKEGNL